MDTNLTDEEAEEITRKTGIVPSQLRKWTEVTNPDAFLDRHLVARANEFFLVLGFYRWQDSEPTVMILDNGEVTTDWFVDYIRDFSSPVE